MKKAKAKSARPRAERVSEDEILPEYDFSGARQNSYAARFPMPPVVVTIESDLVALFPDSAAVNDALRALAKIVERKDKKGRSRIPSR